MGSVANSDADSIAGLPARERILRTAHDLFYRDGVRATGIDRVIARARVTKVTFYRHYPSKDELVLAYLAYRHERWMAWLRDALRTQLAAGHAPLAAVLRSFEGWWRSPEYRGCAFINAATELGAADPRVLDIVRRHKSDMCEAFEALLPRTAGRASTARAVALAVDGAIVHAQMGVPLAQLLRSLRVLLGPLLEARHAPDGLAPAGCAAPPARSRPPRRGARDQPGP